MVTFKGSKSCVHRIGLSLLDTVDEMVRDGSLSAELANVVMARVSLLSFISPD